MSTKHLAELDERDRQLEQRLAKLRDELAVAQRDSVSTAAIQRAVALFDPVWDLLLVPERFRIFHLLLESVVYDGATRDIEVGGSILGRDDAGALVRRGGRMGTQPPALRSARMAFPTEANSQIIDAVAQTSVSVLGNTEEQAPGNLNQARRTDRWSPA